jgi:Co/Zn/Cd efflux system component
MPGCHHHDTCCDVTFDGQSAVYKRILWVVVALNGGMFLTELVGGALADSMALQADALDFLGDTLTYAASLLVIGRAAHIRANVAIVKGLSLAVMGVLILGLTIHKTVVQGAPDAFVMSGIGVAALAANAATVLLLLKYRSGDANVRSVWLCSRNDAIGNVAVILAAGAVAWTGTPWPDLIVAVAMASLFLHSSTLILRQAFRERRDALAVPDLAD